MNVGTALAEFRAFFASAEQVRFVGADMEILLVLGKTLHEFIRHGLP